MYEIQTGLCSLTVLFHGAKFQSTSLLHDLVWYIGIIVSLLFVYFLRKYTQSYLFAIGQKLQKSLYTITQIVNICTHP